jgi:hypothetical protein
MVEARRAADPLTLEEMWRKVRNAPGSTSLIAV